jgi:site-specific DNA-methyltransferase (adenine-specific)
VVTIELLQGDCLELMKSIPDKSIDMILCDLPYSNGITACKWDNMIPLNKLWKQYSRIIKDHACIVLFGQEPFSSLVRTSNLEMYRYDWIWQKQKPSNFQLMNYQCGRVHENIMVFSKAKACYTKNGTHIAYNPQKEIRDKPRTSNAKIYGKAELLHGSQRKDNIRTYNDRMPISILKFNTEANKVHPAQKPTILLEYLIKTYTNENETVLDNCMGSGSTGVACLNTSRNFVGIELDENYFNIAKERIKESAGKAGYILEENTNGKST